MQALLRRLILTESDRMAELVDELLDISDSIWAGGSLCFQVNLRELLYDAFAP